MTLYDTCKELSSVFEPNESGDSSIIDLHSGKETTLPSVLSNTRDSFSEWDCLPVYYISDIHLARQVMLRVETGADENTIFECVKDIARSLFNEDLASSISPINPLIFFGGDISAAFVLAECFYREFISCWNEMDKSKYEKRQKEYKSIIHKYNLLKKANTALLKEINIWKNDHSWSKRVKKPLSECLRTPERIKDIIKQQDETEQNLKILRCELPYDNYWKRPWEPSQHRIFAILGNHELWDFESVELCYSAYERLFKELNIVFLNNKMFFSDKLSELHYAPSQDTTSNIDLSSSYSSTSTSEQYMNHNHKTIIVGGIGFAPYNMYFNADFGIYRNTVNRRQELSLSKDWITTYNTALEYAQNNHCQLIVITHNPVSDWLSEKDGACNCVYFNGHTHINMIFHSDEANTHIYADNQIGYRKRPITFKKTYIYKKYNPFAGYCDGVHEINSCAYLEFYNYMYENIAGNGLVENQIKHNSGHFYMIKHEDYYGFFLTTSKSTFICAGGKIKKINGSGSIDRYNSLFMKMINSYITVLSPYRAVQEKISESIKAIGAYGNIHGCIIDIDFFNHIMINPADGVITYYYSPAFGYIKSYKSLLELLTNHCINLLEPYKNLYKESNDLLALQSQNENNNEIQKIDIKNSIYSLSSRMNQLQRLFDKHILRDWNDDLMPSELKISST